MTIAASITSVNKDFICGTETLRILHGIDLVLKTGELTMIVGPSGCGKTTLVSLIAGILSPTEGRIEVMGQLLNDLSDEKKAIFRRNNVGLIFQQYNLIPSLTAAENGAIALITQQKPFEQALELSRAALKQIGMGHRTESYPAQLSGGEQQRVAIARALVHNPKLLICDEPTAALDMQTGAGVMDILRKAASELDRAVLIITHDPRIYHYADRIIEMNDGKIIGDYKGKSFIEKERL